MRVYFINYHRFEGTSGIHIHFLANTLQKMGVECIVCLPSDPDSVNAFGDVFYRSLSFSELGQHLKEFSTVKDKVLLHAWTPREVVRKFSEKWAKRLNAPYIVHLEDNEEKIFETHQGFSVQEAQKWFWLRKKIIPSSLIHPDTYQQFIGQASGVTCIVNSLKESVPKSVPSISFSPACESSFFTMPAAADAEVRKELGIAPNTICLTYTGNVHAANVAEVSDLYSAVLRLNNAGYPVTLIRCGENHARLSAEAEQAAPYIIERGLVPPVKLYKYIAAADLLVQPGIDNSFNRYRFPSKLPMFLASGRPVVLPRSNIGKSLKDRENCLLLTNGGPAEIVEKVLLVIHDRNLAEHIGQEGRSFAAKEFSWQKSAEKVLTFYQSILKDY